VSVRRYPNTRVPHAQMYASTSTCSLMDYHMSSSGIRMCVCVCVCVCSAWHGLDGCIDMHIHSKHTHTHTHTQLSVDSHTDVDASLPWHSYGWLQWPAYGFNRSIPLCTYLYVYTPYAYFYACLYMYICNISMYASLSRQPYAFVVAYIMYMHT